MLRRYPILAVLLVVVPFTVDAKIVSVTSCGQVVQGRAVLEGDLDCSTHPGHALVLDGKLELNGLTLTGNATDPAGYSAVDCTGKCRVKIVGPGTIVGGSTAVSGSKVSLAHEITVRDATEWGVTGADVRVSECFVTANGSGLAVGPTGGGGIAGGKVAVRRSSIRINASYGVNALVRVKLNKSSALQNGFVDLRAYAEPALVDSTCGTSLRANLVDTWGVCLGD